MEILTMIGQLLLGLSILVGIHEFGHFATAKYFKIRVDKFYIFFDFLFPLPNVLNFALLKKKIGETEYGLGWFPLGGYVAIHGMIDETQDADALAAEPQPNEFRAKPAWQRLIVMLGGIIMNVITGIFIFWLVVYGYGESYTPLEEVKYGVVPNDFGKELGFKRGDKIVKANGRPLEGFEDIYDSDVLFNKGSYYTVDRGGELIDIPLPANMLSRLDDKKQKRQFVTVLTRYKVGEVNEKSPASKAGLQKGDEILRVGDKSAEFFTDLQDALQVYANKEESPSLIQRIMNRIKGVTITPAPKKVIPLVVKRNGEEQTLQVRVDGNGTIGFMPDIAINQKTRYYDLLTSLPKGANKAISVITNQGKAIGMMISGDLPVGKSLGGPVEIAKQYGGIWIWERFWVLTGSLSMVLAFMNLLPIPALDGGHVVFLLYEMIAGRKPSDKFLENAQKVGTALILSLMLYVLVIKQILY